MRRINSYFLLGENKGAIGTRLNNQLKIEVIVMGPQISRVKEHQLPSKGVGITPFITGKGPPYISCIAIITLYLLHPLKFSISPEKNDAWKIYHLFSWVNSLR